MAGRTAINLEKKLDKVGWSCAVVAVHTWAFCRLCTSGDCSHSGVVLVYLSLLLMLSLHSLDSSSLSI